MLRPLTNYHVPRPTASVPHLSGNPPTEPRKLAFSNVGEESPKEELAWEVPQEP